MRAGNPVVVAVVGGLALALSTALARMASAQPAVEPGELEIYDAIPAEETLHVQVGERRQFSIWVRGERLVYQWMLDGGPVGDRHAWTFTPRPTDLGLHLVTVVAEGPDGRISRSWRVQVDVATAPPPGPTSSLPAPTSPSTTSTTGRAIATSTTSTTEEPSTSSTREPTTTSTRLPTTTSTRLPTTTSTRLPTTTSTREPTTSTRAPTTSTTERLPTTTTTSSSTRPPTTLARTGAINESEVRALFDRYEAAWRNHDIAALESVGQVATQGQADALKSYFESVRDLEVQVTILAVTITGDEARVRFIRRDRFRDPGGSMVTKESPVIEKRVVRTPGGLRLAPVR